MLLKKIETAHGFYVYDTWTNEILEVDATVFAALPGGEATQAPPGDRARAEAEIAAARAAGYFSPQRPHIANFPLARFEAYRARLEAGPDHLIVAITERCNFRCRYCTYSGAYQDMRAHSDRRMSRETLFAAIDWLTGFARESYGIGFYGGEPLMELPLIREAVAHIRARTDKPVAFRMTTNGALLTAKTCKFLIDNDFRVNVSIDGPQWVNDRHRRLKRGGGGFARTWAGLRRLREAAPDYFARRVTFSVVAAPPVALNEIHAFMEDNPEIFRDHLINVSAVSAHPSTLPDDLKPDRAAFLREREALFKTFRDDLLAGKTSSFAFRFFNDDFLDLHQRDMSRMGETTTSDGQCLPGSGKCMVDVDGNLHMCEKIGASRPIGHVSRGLDIEAILAFLGDYDAFLPAACSRCWMVRLCSKCCIHFREGDALSKERLSRYCRSQEERWSWALQRYIEMREADPDIFGLFSAGSNPVAAEAQSRA